MELWTHSRNPHFSQSVGFVPPFIISGKCIFEVQVVFCEPIPAYHLEALKVLIKKAAYFGIAHNASARKQDVNKAKVADL